jgi:hypothetical protein
MLLSVDIRAGAAQYTVKLMTDSAKMESMLGGQSPGQSLCINNNIKRRHERSGSRSMCPWTRGFGNERVMV